MNIIESPLWHRIHDSGMSTLAVMGMTKNTGKTVAMNHVLAQAAAAQVEVGLTSIGRDGEDRDQVFFNPKPPIMVWPGTLVATARETLQRAKVRWKLIASTEIDSPMGEILVEAMSFQRTFARCNVSLAVATSVPGQTMIGGLGLKNT